MDFLTGIGLLVVIYHMVYMILPWFSDCDLKMLFYEKFGIPISALIGKVVWITGASSGIGEHLAYVLAEAGCKLILSARRKIELEKVKANCLQLNTNLQTFDIKVLILDVCDISKHESAFNSIISQFGKLDILVNNAGRSQRAHWEKIDLDVDREMFDLNVFSQVALSRLVANYFFKIGTGHFVITSSIAGVIATPFSATYCATKFSLHGYFKSFLIENVTKNIPVTIICPGPIQTNFLAQAYTDKIGEKYEQAVKENSSNKVSTARCAKLMGIAIANELQEVWIAKPLVLQLVYLMVYYPNLGTRIIKKLGPRFVQRLRDDKATLKQEQ